MKIFWSPGWTSHVLALAERPIFPTLVKSSDSFSSTLPLQPQVLSSLLTFRPSVCQSCPPCPVPPEIWGLTLISTERGLSFELLDQCAGDYLPKWSNLIEIWSKSPFQMTSIILKDLFFNFEAFLRAPLWPELLYLTCWRVFVCMKHKHAFERHLRKQPAMNFTWICGVCVHVNTLTHTHIHRTNTHSHTAVGGERPGCKRVFWIF